MSEVDRIFVGNRIKEERELCGFSQEEVAAYLRLASYRISLIESGKEEPMIWWLSQLAEMFRIKIEDFFKDAIPEPPLVFWRSKSKERRCQMAIYRVCVVGEYYSSIECESFRIEGGRLCLESYDNDCEPIDVAIFNNWEFCIREDLIRTPKEEKRPTHEK